SVAMAKEEGKWKWLRESKKPPVADVFRCSLQPIGYSLEKTRRKAGFSLLDLRFLVDHVLADFGVEFLDLHLLRMQAFVLRRRIEMSRTGGRDQLDLFAHDSALLFGSAQTWTPCARN